MCCGETRMGESNYAKKIINSLNEKKKDEEKIFATKKQQLSSLEHLLDRVEQYKKGLPDGEVTFLMRASHLMKKTYDRLIGTDYASSSLEKTLNRSKKDLTNLQKENYALRAELEGSLDRLVVQTDSLHATLRQAQQELAEEQKTYVQKEEELLQVKKELEQDEFSSIEKGILESYLREQQLSLDAKKNVIDLKSSSVHSYEGVYQQLLEEVTQEQTFLEFQKQHEAIIETNITIIDTYLQREQKSTDETAMMETQQVILGSTNAMRDAQHTRAGRVTAYESATKSLSSYASITKAFSESLRSLSKRVVGIAKK